jgi:hypothetical protein
MKGHLRKYSAEIFCSAGGSFVLILITWAVCLSDFSA